MKIGVVSDTHSQEVPKQVLDAFQKVDFIIHAGDFCSVRDLEVFTKIKDVKAVYGNMDDPGIRKILPRRQIIECDSYKVGIYHGEGSSKRLLDVVQKEFENEDVDVVVFGHSHHPYNELLHGVLYFNPGSPNDNMFAPYCSYGILEIEGDHLSGKIIKVSNDR